jgi:hypothetical protein
MRQRDEHPNQPKKTLQVELHARHLARYSTVKRATRLVSNPKKNVLEAPDLKAGMVSRTVTTAERHIKAVMKT